MCHNWKIIWSNLTWVLINSANIECTNNCCLESKFHGAGIDGISVLGVTQNILTPSIANRDLQCQLLNTDRIQQFLFIRGWNSHYTSWFQQNHLLAQIKSNQINSSILGINSETVKSEAWELRCSWVIPLIWSGEGKFWFVWEFNGLQGGALMGWQGRNPILLE